MIVQCNHYLMNLLMLNRTITTLFHRRNKRSFSILKHINDYQRATTCQSRMTALSILAIESEMMHSL